MFLALSSLCYRTTLLGPITPGELGRFQYLLRRSFTSRTAFWLYLRHGFGSDYLTLDLSSRLQLCRGWNLVQQTAQFVSLSWET